MDNIEKLIQLNAEIEGLLHVLSRRDNQTVRNLLGSKFEEYMALYEDLKSYLNDHPIEEAACNIENDLKENETLEHILTKEEVKEQEAVSDEVDDEISQSVEAIHRGEEDNSAERKVISESEDSVSDLANEDDSTDNHTKDDITAEITSVEHSQSIAADFESDTANSTTDAGIDEDVIIPIVLSDETNEDENNVYENASSDIVEDVDSQTDFQSIGESRFDEIRVDEMLSRKGAVNLKKVFTLNDKFRFRRSLFNQNDIDFAETLDELATLTTFEDAKNHLQEKYGWDMTVPEVEDFLSIIKPHYAR